MLCVIQPTRSYPLLFSYSTESNDGTDSGSVGWIEDSASDIWAGNNCLHIKSMWSGTSIPENSLNEMKAVSYDTTYQCTVYRHPSIGYNIGFANISLEKEDGSYTLCQPGLVISGSVQKTINGWKASENKTVYSYRQDNKRQIFVKTYSQSSESSYYASAQEARAAVEDRIFWSRDYGETLARTIETSWSTPVPPIAQHHYALWHETKRRFSELTEACDLSYLSQKVAEHCDFNRTNFLALAHDIMSIKSEIKNWSQMVDTLFSSSTRKEALKGISNIFLSGKYGIRLTYADIAQQSERILNESKIGFRPSRIYETTAAKLLILSDWYTGTSGLSLKWRYNPVNNTEKFLAQYIGDIRIQDFWDLIPYSFVVDWFLGIGDHLELFDLQKQFDKCDVTDIWYTTKLRGQHIVQTQTASGIIVHQIFARFGLQNLPPLSAGSSTPVAHQHLAEGASLIIQRM